MKTHLARLTLLLCIVCAHASAENWPRFRGPNGAGVASDANIPAEWTQDGFAWRIALPGKGNSSPVVWGDRVYVTSANESTNTYSLLAYDVANGELVWQRDTQYEPMRVNPQNGFATSTPAADDRGVYTMSFGQDQARIMATSHDGEELWSVDFGAVVTLHGPSLSPTVYDGKLVFSLEQEGAGPQGYWYALDCANGETLWKLERDSNGKASSSVPCVYAPANAPAQLLFSSFGHGITSVNAETGAVLWEEPSALIARAVGSPIVEDDFVIAACGRRGGGMRLSVLQLDNEPRTLHAIEDRYVPYVPTPVAHDGFVYTFADAGTVSCVNIQSAELVWSERLRAKFAGSPVIAGDKLYCPTMDGQVVVVKAGPQFEQLAENPLGEATQSTPAIAGNQMFFRTESHLMCINGEGKSG